MIFHSRPVPYILTATLYSPRYLGHISLILDITLIDCFKQKSYLHSRGPYRSRAAPHTFCLPVSGQLSFNACIIILRVPDWFRDSKQQVRTAIFNARAGLLQLFVVTISLRLRNGAVWKSCGTLMGPVWVPQDMKKIRDSRTKTARASQGVHMESCELLNRTINVQSCKPYEDRAIRILGPVSI